MAEDALTKAKELLQREGYVVIPMERHRVFKVQRSVSCWEMERMRDDGEAKRFREYLDNSAIHQFGPELANQGFVLKEDIGFDPSFTRYLTEYSVGVIKPLIGHLDHGYPVDT